MADFREYDIDLNEHCHESSLTIELDSEEDRAPPSLIPSSSSSSNFDVKEIDIEMVESEKSTSEKKKKRNHTDQSGGCTTRK